jgi:dTMP kinase
MTNALPSIANRLAGKFIVLDGGDGCGKSTQLDLLADAMESAGLTVCRLRDPGSTATGDRIREILLSCETGDLSPACEMLLFMASRAQMLAEKIQPALDAGHVVLCDRFVSSTLAYQGASGVDVANVTKVWELAGGIWPDLTLILVMNVEDQFMQTRDFARMALERATNETGGDGDRIEKRGLDYHTKVLQGFFDLALKDGYPGLVRLIDANVAIPDVAHNVERALTEVFA